jgi:plastocyanin
LLKKITILGITVATILIIVSLSIFDYFTEENNDEVKLIVKGDVVMPSKVSRPGCEKIDRCYVPSLIVIGSGNSVTWVNEDSAFHSVTSGFYNSPSGLFDSGYLDPSESFTFTFDESGTYDYFCTLHPWMAGQVIVE